MSVMKQVGTIGICLILLVAIGIDRVSAQPDVSQVSVSTERLKQHISTLASDEFAGRQVGTPGQLLAANYCIRTFRQNHLAAPFRFDSTQASFRQAFAFTTTTVSSFGSARMYGSNAPVTTSRRELVPLPQTAKDSSKVLFGFNVGGLLIGGDLKTEIVVISAHYDHLGKSGNRFYPGADDNASGTATVLEVAAVFDSLARQGVRSRRSVLFVLFSGEEAGLLGSLFFVYNSPIPLQQFKADLNVDMVGRVDQAHQKSSDYCYLIRDKQSAPLQNIAEAVNRKTVGLALNRGGYDTDNDPEQFFYRSDQYNFAKLGIPALFFTSGQHPDYHQYSDTADKINYNALKKRATLVFQTAWRVANEK